MSRHGTDRCRLRIEASEIALLLSGSLRFAAALSLKIKAFEMALLRAHGLGHEASEVALLPDHNLSAILAATAVSDVVFPR